MSSAVSRPVHEPPAASATGRVPRWLALGAVAGPVLFTLAWFVLGFVSPGFPVGGEWVAPYSPVAHPISGLGMGETAPYMNSAFVVGGLLLLAGVIGAFRTIAADRRTTGWWTSVVLLGLAPVGLVLAGLFDLDHELPHFVGFGLAAGTPVISFAVAGQYLRGVPSWRRFGTWLLAAGSPMILLLMVVYLVSFDEAATSVGEGVAGLTSRLLGLGHAWFCVLGWLAFRRAPGAR